MATAAPMAISPSSFPFSSHISPPTVSIAALSLVFWTMLYSEEGTTTCCCFSSAFVVLSCFALPKDSVGATHLQGCWRIYQVPNQSKKPCPSKDLVLEGTTSLPSFHMLSLCSSSSMASSCLQRRLPSASRHQHSRRKTMHVSNGISDRIIEYGNMMLDCSVGDLCEQRLEELLEQVSASGSRILRSRFERPQTLF